jgi:hypothetical protein
MRIFIVSFMVVAGCATAPVDDPKEEVEAWPCGSIARFNGSDVSSTRYAYDDLHNVLWQQKTSLDGAAAGSVAWTATKTFDGKIAITEEYVEPNSYMKTERSVVDGRIMTETFIQDHEAPLTATWTYADGRVVRIDRQDATGAAKGYSVFTYPDANTRVERNCTTVDSCSTETRLGGVDTYTTLRQVTADGTSTYEETRTLDANGLPTLSEGAYIKADGARDVISHVEIERRADGAPLFVDDGRIETTYQFSCH